MGDKEKHRHAQEWLNEQKASLEREIGRQQLAVARDANENCPIRFLCCKRCSDRSTITCAHRQGSADNSYDRATGQHHDPRENYGLSFFETLGFLVFRIISLDDAVCHANEESRNRRHPRTKATHETAPKAKCLRLRTAQGWGLQTSCER